MSNVKRRRLTAQSLVWLLAFGLWLSAMGLAQTPTEVARQAVQDWQAGKYQIDPSQALGKTPEEAIRVLERSIAFASPPPNLSVNLAEPQTQQTPSGTLVRFPATVGAQGGEVRVTLRGGEVTRIAFAPQGGLLPGWVKSPVAWALFIALSLGWLLALRGNTGLALWWREGWALIQQYRRTYIGLNIALYGLYILGSVVAYAEPRLVKLLQEMVGGALEQVGIGGAASAGPLGLALVIFYWNLTRGLLLTTAVPGLALGIPALLINGLRYFIFGFALSPVAIPMAAFVAHIPTLIIELQAYILGTFGGLVLLNKVLQGEGYRAGLRALALLVYLGMFFLLIGAWYEAFEVLYLVR
ncbi:MAG: stage II sporulation protein M [Thermaceae bacterium]|nr:stage II sporulation protein M [Thermaceae bacterium]